MISQALAQEISQLEADFCFALSDPTRLLILYALGDGPHNVTELATELELIQPTTSRHLKVLRERGLVYPWAPTRLGIERRTSIDQLLESFVPQQSGIHDAHRPGADDLVTRRGLQPRGLGVEYGVA